MIISSLVAAAQNGVIGIDNKLPWHLPADLKLFKRLTMGHHILMGRKCYESIGKPLPGRISIVISRNPDYKAEGCIVLNSIEDGIEYARQQEEEELFIIGGAEIFKETLDQWDILYLTIIEENIEGDVYLPKIDWTKWSLKESEFFQPDEKNKYNYSFNTFIRRL